MTAQTIVSAALRKNGKKNPDNTLLGDALTDLNAMLSLWSVEGLLIPNVTKENFSLTSGMASRTIGDSGDLNTVRPVKLVDAYLRDSNSQDHPVKVDMSLKEYNEITVKSTSSRPTRFYYHPTYPLGIIYFNYTTDASYTLYLDSLKQLTEFTDLDTDYDLPLEYKIPLTYNLTIFISHDFDQQLSPDIFQIAGSSKASIMANNLQIEPLKGDTALLRTGIANILTGE